MRFCKVYFECVHKRGCSLTEFERKDWWKLCVRQKRLRYLVLPRRKLLLWIGGNIPARVGSLQRIQAACHQIKASKSPSTNNGPYLHSATIKNQHLHGGGICGVNMSWFSLVNMICCQASAPVLPSNSIIWIWACFNLRRSPHIVSQLCRTAAASSRTL